MNGKDWLVWSTEHFGWWGPDRKGYYKSGNSAGRYTLQEALNICKACNAGHQPGLGKMPPEILHPAPEFIDRLLNGEPDSDNLKKAIKRIVYLESAIIKFRDAALHNRDQFQDFDNDHVNAVLGAFDDAFAEPVETLPKPDAVARAQQMMVTPQGQLPELALRLVRHLANRYGLCGEVCLTAYACYAQVVEGLPCTDGLYSVKEEERGLLESWMKEKAVSP